MKNCVTVLFLLYFNDSPGDEPRNFYDRLTHWVAS